METATVVVAPAPVAIAPTPQRKLMELKSSFAPAAKPSPARKPKPAKKKLAGGSGGYVLEDVPHLTDYLPELKVSCVIESSSSSSSQEEKTKRFLCDCCC